MKASLFLSLLLLCSISIAQEEIFLGVTTNVAENRGILAVNDPATGKPYIAAFGMDSAGGLHRRCFLLLTDVQTGRSEQFWYPDAHTGNGELFHLLRSSDGKIYTTIGNARQSVFLQFDLAKREWSYQTPVQGMAMSFTEAPDGKIYFATYPQSLLYEFSPQSRTTREVAQLDPQEKYPFSLAAGDDGWLYAGIGTARSNFVGVDLQSGNVRPLLPEAERLLDSAEVHRGTDGLVYARASRTNRDSTQNPWYRLQKGTAQKLSADVTPTLATRSNIHFFHTLNDFPDGGRILSFSMPERLALVQDASGKLHTLAPDYQSDGANNTVIALGADGMIYGNTNHPTWFFRFDPSSKTFTDIGTLRGGLLTNMVPWGKYMVGAAYPNGGLYLYDTTRPWQPAEAGQKPQEPNPKLLTRFDNIRRPRVTRLLRDGKTVVIGGFPGYGHTSGGIALYDLQTNTSQNWSLAEAFPGQSAFVIRELADGLLAVGTSTETPGGGHRTAERANIFLFDPETLSVVHRQEVDLREIRALEPMPDGRVLCLGVTQTEGRSFVFDPVKRNIVSERNITEHGIPVSGGHSLLANPESGELYAILSDSICRVRADGSLEPLLRVKDKIYAGSVFLDGEIYYTSGSRLLKFRP